LINHLKSIIINIQVILATQSTLLIDCFEVEDIIIVKKKNRQSYFNRLSRKN